MARDLSGGTKFLVLGNVIPARSGFDEFNEMTSITYDDLRSLECEAFEALDADFVISPPFSGMNDCLDVAEDLERLSFRGKFIVIAQNLPNPKLISSEIAAICPSVMFEIMPSFGMLNYAI